MAADRTCVICGRVFRARGARANTAVACSCACAGKYRSKKRRPASERFWKFVEKTETCWIWHGNKNPNGYAQFWDGGRVMKSAVKVAYKLCRGEVTPTGLHALHKCDNPACVNPDHIFFGTHQDNMADMVAKKRHVHGERTCTAVLTDAQVIELRRRRAAGETEHALAAAFSINRSTVSAIFRGKLWKHLPGAVARMVPNRTGPARSVQDDSHVVTLHRSGLSFREIAERLNIKVGAAYTAWIRGTTGRLMHTVYPKRSATASQK